MVLKNVPHLIMVIVYWLVMMYAHFSEINKVKSKPFSTSFKRQLSYFLDCTPLVIDYKGLLDSLSNISSNLNKYNPHNYKKLGFMISILKYQLRKVEGVSWVRK